MSNLSFKISFETIVISTMLNVILPAKSGELSKAIYLKKLYNFSYHKAISIVFVERFFDVIILLLFMFLWMYEYFVSDILKKFVIIFTLLLFLVIILFNTKIFLRFLQKIPNKFLRIYTQKVYFNVHKLLKSFWSIFFYTAFIWLIYYLTNVVFFKYAVNFDLSLSVILELFVVSSIAFALPLAPGGFGAFEGAVVFVLTAHGIPKEQALMSATVYHLVLLLMDFVLFYPVVLIKDLKINDFKK
jgi:hypothetical protein